LAIANGVVSPALHEFFESLKETVHTSIASLPETVAKLTAKKVKAELLEMQDVQRKEAANASASTVETVSFLVRCLTRRLS
jgi:hypothetical protein